MITMFGVRTGLRVAACSLMLSSVALAGDIVKRGQGLEGAKKECVAHLAALNSKAETWRWIAVALAALGGGIASFSGVRAGLSKRDVARKWGYAALVSGVLAAVSPFLPKSEGFRDRLTQSDRHYIVGLKVQRQLDGLEPGLVQAEAANYAMARFTDCLAEDPPKAVPELPSGLFSIVPPELNASGQDSKKAQPRILMRRRGTRIMTERPSRD
jgi:MFS family permease